MLPVLTGRIELLVLQLALETSGSRRNMQLFLVAAEGWLLEGHSRFTFQPRGWLHCASRPGSRVLVVDHPTLLSSPLSAGLNFGGNLGKSVGDLEKEHAEAAGYFISSE